jgi:glycosyltransferase involved in cell wall biosynthesis
LSGAPRAIGLDMKFYVLFTLRPAPYGGGNQFLEALAKALARVGRLAGAVSGADVVLFNSHHDLKDVLSARRAFPSKVFIHRVDGPMRLYTDMSDRRDAVVLKANRLLADGTVFQSRWSRDANMGLDWPPPDHHAVIGNAPDPVIFNRDRWRPPSNGGKVRLIASSWSSNPKKGFAVYRHLGSVLDTSRYEMVFVGNAPEELGNVRIIPPLGSGELADELKKSHIFVTASQSDPCSNSLIEALHCGLPVLALNDGGHPELVGTGGELFDDVREVPEKIERLCRDYRRYSEGINAPTIQDIAEKYAAFAESLLERSAAGHLVLKRPGFLKGKRFVAELDRALGNIG